MMNKKDLKFEEIVKLVHEQVETIVHDFDVILDDCVCEKIANKLKNYDEIYYLFMDRI
ncbi:MAG: hypothetical protein SGJ10_11545 [Bacteroidota bacterium]|nr:hypothetical protein [Bacteroidota bacterium]